jgi:PAS domain-containing protein
VGWFVAAEDLQLRAKPIKRDERTLDESGIAALARAASESREVVERSLRAEIATLEAQSLRYQTAIDAIAQGLGFFDGEDRLILSNRRYAEIYRLAPEQVRPGMTLREIVELRVAAGTSPIAAEDYLAVAASVKSAVASRTWTAEL